MTSLIRTHGHGTQWPTRLNVMVVLMIHTVCCCCCCSCCVVVQSKAFLQTAASLAPHMYEPHFNLATLSEKVIWLFLDTAFMFITTRTNKTHNPCPTFVPLLSSTQKNKQDIYIRVFTFFYGVAYMSISCTLLYTCVFLYFWFLLHGCIFLVTGIYIIFDLSISFFFLNQSNHDRIISLRINKGVCVDVCVSRLEICRAVTWQPRGLRMPSRSMWTLSSSSRTFDSTLLCFETLAAFIYIVCSDKLCNANMSIAKIVLSRWYVCRDAPSEQWV